MIADRHTGRHTERWEISRDIHMYMTDSGKKTDSRHTHRSEVEGLCCRRWLQWLLWDPENVYEPPPADRRTSDTQHASTKDKRRNSVLVLGTGRPMVQVLTHPKGSRPTSTSVHRQRMPLSAHRDGNHRLLLFYSACPQGVDQCPPSLQRVTFSTSLLIQTGNTQHSWQCLSSFLGMC